MYIKATGEPIFLSFGIKKAFNHLWQAFIKALILQYFNLECHIQIKTNASCYAIRRVLSQLSTDWVILDKLNLAKFKNLTKFYFSRKMILSETWYETHDAKLLAIFEVFKIWRHYLEGCKHEVLILTDLNNLCRFMDIKSLSSC